MPMMNDLRDLVANRKLGPERRFVNGKRPRHRRGHAACVPFQPRASVFVAKPCGSGLDIAAALAQPWLVNMRNFVVRLVLWLAVPGFVLTACNRHGGDLRQQVVGTWVQGPHTLTLAPDGSYTSVFPGKPTITYKAKWHIDRGYLVVTEIKSNSVPVAGNNSVKIVLVEPHRLEMAMGTNRISMVR